MVKNLPSNARAEELIPGQGTKIPYTAGQLSLHATAETQADKNKYLRTSLVVRWLRILLPM